VPNSSTYLQTAILRWLVRNTQMATPPANVYVSLHTGDPGQTGANEVVTTAGTGWVGYARQAVTTGTSGTGAGSGFGAPAANGTLQQSQNGGAITFPASGATSGTVTVTHFGVWDAVTGGNYLIGGALSATQVIGANASGPSFAASALTVQEQ
jgi:hypothetical protein